jgi:hypothetical protein
MAEVALNNRATNPSKKSTTAASAMNREPSHIFSGISVIVFPDHH